MDCAGDESARHSVSKWVYIYDQNNCKVWVPEADHRVNKLKMYPRIFDNKIEQLLNEVDICHVCPFENEIYDEYHHCVCMVEEWLKVSPDYAAKQFFKYIMGEEYTPYSKIKKAELKQVKEGLELCV